ncbi:hypothetical protein PR048_012903 [Dryococelus australis]|uniref:Uncharacterized protein n=1 Tax=Dryococelus australis TaxID=614101 RepID=A0ABQ9HQU0_9NEOP|nr:hypothetical protein PR048_012903 [Dryococelus australis]
MTRPPVHNQYWFRPCNIVLQWWRYLSFADMLMVHDDFRKNSVCACHVYAERYTNIRQQVQQLFANLLNELCKTGMAREEGEIINYIAAVALNQQVSSRATASWSGMSQAIVLHILYYHKFHLYHVSLHQELHGNDFEYRTTLCSCILFSEETLTNQGEVNLENRKYALLVSTQSPLASSSEMSTSMECKCVVWNCEPISYKPIFIEGALDSLKYVTLLTDDLPQMLVCLPLHTRKIELALWWCSGLGDSPPTKAIQVRFLMGSPSVFRIFLGNIPFPPPFHSDAAVYLLRCTLIASQDLDVTSHLNLFRQLQLVFTNFFRNRGIGRRFGLGALTANLDSEHPALSFWPSGHHIVFHHYGFHHVACQYAAILDRYI